MTPVSVSVVIPCFNVEHTIGLALDSVAAQTRPVCEVICVDDASTDHTRRVIADWQARNAATPVRVLQMPRNSGPSAARNLGWDAAVGEYIAFLDADDAWHPQKIAVQYEWMRTHPPVALSGHTHLVAEQSDRTALPMLSAPRAYTIARDEILISNPFVTPSVMLKRSLTERFNPQRRYTEDYLLWMQICLAQHIVVLLDLPLVIVSRGAGQSKLSRNYFRMRVGDVQNYWQLWRAHQIGLFRMIFLIPFSLLKFLLLLTFPSTHAAIKRRLYTQPLPEED
ncbi:MAG: glycosyltransferase family 2 protein [Chloroflexi bacterium]|nr:glycosyltransferase family 2 protein [Chloroflexota bacterium]